MNAKKDTPMKRLSTHFQVMEQELRRYGAVKKCLNKAAPRSNLEYSENDKKAYLATLSLFSILENTSQAFHSSSITLMNHWATPLTPKSKMAKVMTQLFHQSLSNTKSFVGN